MDKHKHEPATTGPPRCYDGGVAGRGGIENRAAHGNIQVCETCLCGATRAVLVNGRHIEEGPWRKPSAAMATHGAAPHRHVPDRVGGGYEFCGCGAVYRPTRTYDAPWVAL